MSESKFTIGSVNTTQGAVSFGDNNKVINTNNVASQNVESAATGLIESLARESMPNDMKDELIGNIRAITEQAKSDKPNKSMVSSLFGAVEKVINVVEKSPALITAWDKWKGFIEPIFNTN